MILITGATGSNGTEILKRLTAKNVPVKAMVRDPKRAEAIQGPNVELVTGDFDRPETLAAALRGVERAFLLTNSTEYAQSQQLAFVTAAQQAGVAHIVYLSQLHATRESPVRFLRYHAVVEDALKASGMDWTFLRPNLYMQALLGFRDTIKEKNAFYASAGGAAVSLVDVRDIADAAVAALTEPGHAGKTYDLTGPEALTHAQLAEQLSAALGRTITFTDIPEDAMCEAMIGMKMPPWQADGLIEDYAHYRRGEASAVGTGVQDATGHAPGSFAAFAHDYAGQFA